MTDTYMPEKPCRNGHFAPRLKLDGRCVECKAEKDARYYARHAEKLKAQATAYHEANKQRNNARQREYHARRKDDPAYQAVRSAYNETHRERLTALAREKRNTPEAKAAKAALKRAKRAEYTAYENNRRAREAQAQPTWFGELDELAVIEAADLCLLRKIMTGFDWQTDHMIPILAKCACGLHCAANLQVIPRTLNARKSNKMQLTEPFEWLAHV